MSTAMISRRSGSGGLTTREVEVAHLITAGKTNRDIAAILNISHRTVEHHVAAIFSKLNVTSRLQIALRWITVQQTLN